MPFTSSSSSFATRIPLPPPPAVALMMTGKPISSAINASCSSSTIPVNPVQLEHLLLSLFHVQRL